MTTPAIYYNGKTITFPENVYTFQPNPVHNTLRNQSASGLVELLNVNAVFSVSAAGRWFDNVSAATFKRNLRQWFQWAQEGGEWKFAFDSTDKVLTTLFSGASAGDTSVTLTSATGVVAGGTYVIRSKTSINVVRVSSISGAPTVTLTEALDFAFASGSRFRSDGYYPARLPVAVNPNPVVEMPPLHFNFNLQFEEDVNSL